MTERKPILCVDFDGVCHSYTSGWQGADVVSDPPVEGLEAFLLAAHEAFHVNIYSSRTRQEGGIEAMREWFEKHFPGITGILSFPEQKPAAFLTLDDRCIRFEGQFPSIDEMLAFKPWNKK